MSFNTELGHEELFRIVKDIYQSFEAWEEYDPHVCDPKSVAGIKELSESLRNKLESITKDLAILHIINIDSYGC